LPRLNVDLQKFGYYVLIVREAVYLGWRYKVYVGRVRVELPLYEELAPVYESLGRRGCSSDGILPYSDGIVPYGDGIVPYGDGIVPYSDGIVPYGIVPGIVTI
jgi:hypothetical protein